MRSSLVCAFSLTDLHQEGDDEFWEQDFFQEDDDEDDEYSVSSGLAAHSDTPRRV